MTGVVLDTSAVLAWLRTEPGAEQVEAVIPGAWISSVNLVEVLAHVARRGGNVHAASVDLEAYGIAVQPFTATHAELCAQWFLPLTSPELSLADRACLALGQTLGLDVMTTNPAWADLPFGVTVRLLS